MHPNADPNPPTWLGIIFLALGLSTLVFSPRLVAWQLAQIRRTNRWLLNLVGYDGEFVLSQSENDPENESGLTKWRRSSYWFATIFTGLLFVVFGMAVVLKLNGVSVGP